MGEKMKWASLGLMLTALAGCDDTSETIGARGGVVESPDGRMTLEIPAGALDEEAQIFIGEVDDGPASALGRKYEIEPRLTHFALPATLTYDLSLPEGAEGLDPAFKELAFEDLALVTQSRDGWGYLADRAVDDDAETVSGSVMYLSSYALVSR